MIPEPDILIRAAYLVTVTTLLGLVAWVVLDLRRWAKRARKDADL